jgi:hypothetical protein
MENRSYVEKDLEYNHSLYRFMIIEFYCKLNKENVDIFNDENNN